MKIQNNKKFIKLKDIKPYKNIDWTDFLKKVLEILRLNNKKIYIKHDLRIAANGIKLYGNEVNMDEFNVEPFERSINDYNM